MAEIQDFLDDMSGDDLALTAAEEAMTVGETTLDCRILAGSLVAELLIRQWQITAVESCTGGGFLNAVTNIEGASEVTQGGAVTYSNQAKVNFGVPAETIGRYSVYSRETAIAMAIAGWRHNSWAHVSVGITGSLSRQDPANDTSVPGEVFFAIVRSDKPDDPYAERLEVAEDERTNAKLHVIRHVLDVVYKQITE